MWELKCILIVEVWMELYFCNHQPPHGGCSHGNRRIPATSSRLIWIWRLSVIFYSPCILSLQSISGDVADNVSHPRRLDPTVNIFLCVVPPTWPPWRQMQPSICIVFFKAWYSLILAIISLSNITDSFSWEVYEDKDEKNFLLNLL